MVCTWSTITLRSRLRMSQSNKEKNVVVCFNYNTYAYWWLTISGGLTMRALVAAAAYLPRTLCLLRKWCNLASRRWYVAVALLGMFPVTSLITSPILNSSFSTIWSRSSWFSLSAHSLLGYGADSMQITLPGENKKDIYKDTNRHFVTWVLTQIQTLSQG